MSCYMVFSCASQLFLASVIHGHLNKAFALFELEKADGVGHSTELVLHVFIRTFSKSSLPLVMACVIIYFCTNTHYLVWKFSLTTLIHLQLNQTWIAIIIFTACATPKYSSLVTPLLSGNFCVKLLRLIHPKKKKSVILLVTKSKLEPIIIFHFTISYIWFRWWISGSGTSDAIDLLLVVLHQPYPLGV